MASKTQTQHHNQNQLHPSLTVPGRDTMSRLHGSSPKLDLRLYLSPPRHNLGSPGRSRPMSPASSCVSSEDDLRYCSSPEATTTSMLLVGCPNCLMYVMLSEGDPKCPRCKSTVLLDFLHDPTTTPAVRTTRRS